MTSHLLSFLKLRLAGRHFDEKDILLVEEIRKSLSDKESPFTNLIMNSIDLSMQDIKRDDWESANIEVRFIHNLPVCRQDIATWNESYFYTVELMGYIERTKDYLRIKKAINLIAETNILMDRLINPRSFE